MENKLRDVLEGKELELNGESCTVKLLDVMPRLVKRNVEDAIVISARTSTGLGLKSEEQDRKLVRYLLRNAHTSPLESVKLTFHISCPIFTSRHLIRHRTANVNEFSQRYAQVREGHYTPKLRLQCKKNKQSSEEDTKVPEEALSLLEETEKLLKQIETNYEELLKLGVAREVARYCLPLSTWTELVYTLDLNNFIKFLRLRTHESAQKEVREVANFMWQLCKDLMPTVAEYLAEEGCVE